MRILHFYKTAFPETGRLGYLPEESKAAGLEPCGGVLFSSHVRSEASDISFLADAVHGKSMICYEIGTETRYISMRDETGQVVPPSHPTALRTNMHYLLNNPAKAAETERHAKNRHWQYCSAERMAHQYAALHRDLHAKTLH